MPVRSGCSKNRTMNGKYASGKSKGLLHRTGNRLVSIVKGSGRAEAGHFVNQRKSLEFHCQQDSFLIDSVDFSRFCPLCTLHLTFLRSKNRLCASARPDGGNNEHRGHGCTCSGIHRVILYLYSQRVKKSGKTFVECKSQLVTSDRDAIDIAT